MSDARKNFAVSTVATAPSPATSGLSLVVTGGHGTRFPAVPFNAVVCPAGTDPTPLNAEVVRVTGISTDTLTVARTQEGSSARSVVVGDRIYAAVTAKSFADIDPGVFNVKAYGAVGDGTTNDYDEVQAAITAAEVAGGTVLFPPGVYYLNKSGSTGLKLSRNNDGARDWVRLVGMGATIKLSANTPRFLDFTKIADYDIFQKIAVADLTVDANNVGGLHHVVAGTMQNGSVSSGLRTNFTELTFRRIRTVNVLVDSNTGTNHRRNFGFFLNHSAVEEATQTYAKNMLFEDIEMLGGNAGIEVLGTGVSAVGLNVFIDNITVQRWRHDMLAVQSTSFGSSHVQIGSRGFGGRCVVRDGWGRFSGDVGIEVDSLTDVLVENCVMENSYTSAFFFTNYNYPNDPGIGAPTSSNTTLEAQRLTCNNCRAVRTSTAPTRGFRCNMNLSVSLGTLILRNCAWRRTTAPTDGGAGEAILFNAPMVEARTEGFNACLTGVNVDVGAISAVCSLISVQTTGPKVLRMRDTSLDFTGTNASSNSQTIRGIDIGGGTALDTTLEINGVSWNLTLTGWVGGAYALLLGFAGVATLRGSVRNIRVTKTGSFTSASNGILVGPSSGASHLTIPAGARINISDCDFNLMNAGTEVAFSSPSNAAQVFLYRTEWRTNPKAPVTLTPGTYSGGVSTTQYLEGYPATISVSGGSGTLIEASVDGTTYFTVLSQSAAAFNAAFYLDNASYYRITGTGSLPTVKAHPVK